VNAICEGGVCQASGAPAAAAAPGASPSPDVSSPSAPPRTLPATYEERRVSNKPLWLTGAITLSTIYAVGIPVAAGIASESVRAKTVGYSAIPVFGMFIAMADVPMSTGQIVASTVSGIFQTAGFGLNLTIGRF
jgi:hypothetical protein